MRYSWFILTKFRVFGLVVLWAVSNGGSALAYNARVMTFLRCAEKHDVLGDDEIYVTTSIAQSSGRFDHQLAWTGDMNEDRRRDSGYLLAWAGQVNPGEATDVAIHVLEQNGEDHESGNRLAEMFAGEATAKMTGVPYGADLSTYLGFLNPTALADRAFEQHVRGHADSYPGSYTVMLEVSPYGLPQFVFHPSYRARWENDHMVLEGDGTRYFAWTSVTFF
jgi:hypothetical protein